MCSFVWMTSTTRTYLYKQAKPGLFTYLWGFPYCKESAVIRSPNFVTAWCYRATVSHRQHRLCRTVRCSTRIRHSPRFGPKTGLQKPFIFFIARCVFLYMLSPMPLVTTCTGKPWLLRNLKNLQSRFLGGDKSPNQGRSISGLCVLFPQIDYILSLLNKPFLVCACRSYIWLHYLSMRQRLKDSADTLMIFNFGDFFEILSFLISLSFTVYW